MSELTQALLTITGTVQGVGYRYSALREAKKLNLKGYVRNMPDGSVEALVQGEKSQILAFIEWCKEGPAHGNVKNVNIFWQTPNEQYENFEIV